MVDVSSDEETEPINVFQQIRKHRVRPRSPVLKSPRKSPMSVEPRARKLRKTELESLKLDVFEHQDVILPPPDWERPPSPEKSTGNHDYHDEWANPRVQVEELRISSYSPHTGQYLRRESPQRNQFAHPAPSKSPSPRFPEHSQRSEDSSRHSSETPDSPSPSRTRHSPAFLELPALEKQKHVVRQETVVQGVQDSVQDNTQDNDILSELLPSSEGLDPDQLEAIMQQLSAGNPVASMETVSLAEYVDVNYKLPNRDEVAFGPETEEVEVEEQLSRIEKVELAVFTSAIARLRAKMSHEGEALASLRAVRMDKHEHSLPLETLWNSAQLRGEFSGLRAEFRRLRDLRIQLMQLLNDVRHEQGQAHASERAYAQLYERFQEARTIIDEHASTAKEADRLAGKLSESEALLTAELNEYKQLEAEHRSRLDSVQAIISARALQAKDLPNPSERTGVRDNHVENEDNVARKIAQFEESLHANVRTEGSQGVVSLPFMSIRIDPDTGSKQFMWSYPSVCREVLEHYRHLVESRARRSVRELLTLWRRGTTVHRAFVKLMGRGSFLSVTFNPAKEATDFELYEIRTKRTVHVHLQGEHIVTKEEFAELKGL